MKQLTKRRLVTISLLVALTIVSATIGFNCTRMKGLKGFSSEGSSSGVGINEVNVPVAFMTAEQLLKAMFSVTGSEGLADASSGIDTAILTTYNQRNGSLPSLQTLTQATGPTLIAVTNLAGDVCAKTVDREMQFNDANRQQRLFFREFNFSMGLSGQTSDSVSSAFRRLARNAWRRDVASEEVEAMITFAQEFSVGVSPTETARTRELGIAICTAALSSIDALTY